MSVAAKSVLYIRPDSIGDLVVFSSALAELQAAWPEAHHTLLVRSGYEIDLAPLFSQTLHWLVTPVNPFSQRPGEVQAALGILFRDLEKLSIDLIVAPTLNRTWLEVAIAAHFPAARRVALGQRSVDPLFSNALRLELGLEDTAAFEIVPSDEQKFDWDNNHRLVDYLLARPTARRYPQLTVPVAAEDVANEILADRNLRPNEFVAVFVGGLVNVPIKAWPNAAFAQLVRWLQEEEELPVLLLGHETEAGEIEEVNLRLKQLGGSAPPIWVGRDGEIPVLAALLTQARLYVGHDTGAMHIAAALGRPVVGIFGGGHWPRFRAVGARVISVVQPLPCFGCRWDCHFGNAPCIKTITAKEVIGAVEMALEDRRASYDHVWDVRVLSDESINLIQAAAPHYKAIQADRVKRLHLIEGLTREVGIRNTEIAALRRESEIKDQKVIAFGQEAAEKGVELEKLRGQLELRVTETNIVQEAGEPTNREETILHVTPTVAFERSDLEETSLATSLAETNAELESLRRLLDEQVATQLKQTSLTKNLQKSLAEKAEAYGRLDKENRRLVIVVEEKTIDHAFWIKMMADKDVHIRNLDAIIANLRNELTGQAAAAAAPGPPPVTVEVIRHEAPGAQVSVTEIEPLTANEKMKQALVWHVRLRRWMLRIVSRSLARSTDSAGPIHTRRENRVGNESLVDTR